MRSSGKAQNTGLVLRYALLLAVAAICLYGIYDAVRLSWMCDDAFISFRYAKNLINGLGLVYNAGERVDGYTNFLWTIIIAVGMGYGIDPVRLSEALGITSYALTILIFLLLSRRIARGYKPPHLYFPLTALCLSLHHDQHVYATSGLETSFFILIISIGFYSVLLAEKRTSFSLAGLILTLSILTRPEGMIFYVMSIIFILLVKRRKAYIIFYLIPFLIIYVPYWIWHLLYYGYPFPNTFYAKSAYLPYYSQGFRYLSLYFKTYYVLLLVPVLLLVYAVRTAARSRKAKRSSAEMVKDVSPERFSQRIILLALLFVLPYTFSVLRIGGDFMFARFLLPATPFLFLILECLLNKLLAGKTRVAVMVMIVALTFARWNQFKNTKGRDGITYEPSFYPQGIVEETREMGERMKEYFKDMPIVVGYLRCMLVYYADLTVGIELATGLTDKYIAHIPIEKRSRPGHEKGAPEDYLRKRRMNFTFCSVLDKVQFLGNYDIISVHGMGGSIFIYDNDIMEELRKHKDIHFIHFPSYLDVYIKNMDSMPREKVLADYEKFKLFYFDYNDDREHEEAFKKFLKI